jgi:hypothetical protein
MRLGMSLMDVIRAATVTPAKTIGQSCLALPCLSNKSNSSTSSRLPACIYLSAALLCALHDFVAGWDDRIGSLEVGRCADIALLELRQLGIGGDGDDDDDDEGGGRLLLELEDSQSQMRTIEQLLLPVGCWRAGRRVDGVTNVLAEAEKEGRQFPNRDSIASQAQDWEQLQCRDDTMPDAVAELQRANRSGGVRASGAAGTAATAMMLQQAVERIMNREGSAERCEPCGWQERWAGGPLFKTAASGVGSEGCCRRQFA